jgi:hypothetical protein
MNDIVICKNCKQFFGFLLSPRSLWLDVPLNSGISFHENKTRHIAEYIKIGTHD